MGTMDSYDDTKKMLATIRKIQEAQKATSKYGMIQEQNDFEGGEGELESMHSAVKKYMDDNQKPQPETNNGEEKDDFEVINNVEVKIHSEDPDDLILDEEEKGKISQLIDDFRTDVSELVEFGKMNIYPTSAKLDGTLSGVGINFSLSTGDDTGLYLSNPSLLKIDDTSLGFINKLKVFADKYSTAINQLLANRSNN
jgi:hypothetical protein